MVVVLYIVQSRCSLTKILIDTKYLMMLIRLQNGERGVSDLHYLKEYD